VRVTTLRGAVEAGHVAGPVRPDAGTWGSGKDFRVWEGAAVADLVDAGRAVQKRLLDTVDAELGPGDLRRPELDQLARDALLALAGDWPFMVSHDSAARYARERAARHAAEVETLARAVSAGHGPRVAESQRTTDGPFGHLDARLLRRRGPA